MRLTLRLAYASVGGVTVAGPALPLFLTQAPTTGVLFIKLRSSWPQV